MIINGLPEMRIRKEDKGYTMEIKVQKIFGKYWEYGITKNGVPIYYPTQKEAINATLRIIEMNLIDFYK